jgi:hypothetical protein
MDTVPRRRLNWLRNPDIEPARVAGRSRDRVLDEGEEDGSREDEWDESVGVWVLMGLMRSIGRISRLPCKALRTMAAAAYLTSSTPLRKRPSPSRSFLWSGSRFRRVNARARLLVDLVTSLVSLVLEKLGLEAKSWIERRATACCGGLAGVGAEVEGCVRGE